MKGWTLALVFTAGLASALAMTVPMRLALSLLDADKTGLAASDVSGSIWNGRLVATQYRGVRLGDINVSLDPLTVLGATRRFAVQGELGEGTLAAGELRGVELADAVINIESLRSGLPLSGRLRLEHATLLFSADRCIRAEGRIVTDILQHAFSGPELSGGLSCGGEAAVARLSGRTQDIEVDVIVQLDPGGGYQAETRIVSANPAIRRALALAGFAERGNGFARSDKGVLGS